MVIYIIIINIIIIILILYYINDKLILKQFIIPLVINKQTAKKLKLIFYIFILFYCFLY